MQFDAEKEIGKVLSGLRAAQGEIGKTFYRWRQVALEYAGDGVDPLAVGLRAAEVFGKDIGKQLLPRLNWLKGEAAFLMNLGRSLAQLWVVDGGVATAEKGETPTEVFIHCTRDPWPTWAKTFDVPMEEVALSREKMLRSILEDVSVFFNIPLDIEVQKAIPRGEGMWMIRLFKKEE
jgi:hypothetical protein